MSRKWTAKERAAQSKRMKAYWKTVHRISDREHLPLPRAQELYKQGIFKGRSIAEATGQRVFQRYAVRRDKRGRVYIERQLPSGKLERVSEATLDRVKNLTTYNVMVNRLASWTGWGRDRVRGFLSQYPQWRDGVSPLFRKRR